MRLQWLAFPALFLLVTLGVAARPVESPRAAPAPHLAAARADESPKKDAAEKFGRGLKPTPRHIVIKHAVERPFKARAGATLPASVAYVPKQLSFWLNNQVGDCVTAEEAFNQDCAGVFLGDKTIQSWAAKYGFLDGAYLTEVMDQMQKAGFSENGNTYGIGSYHSVNFADEPTLQAALTIAPVKIGIDANALPAGAGNKMGWWATGGRAGEFANEDHCTALAGYGPVKTMFAAVGIDTVPAGWPAKSTTAYLHFTWNTIGVVDHDWIMSTCAEAYVRNPTAVWNGKPQPNPGPGPNPTPPTPPVPPTPPGPTPIPPTPPAPAVGFTGTLTFQNGILISAAESPKTVDDVLAAAFADARVVKAIEEAKKARGEAAISPIIIRIIAAVVPVVIADLAAKKPFPQIVQDVVAAILAALVS